MIFDIYLKKEQIKSKGFLANLITVFDVRTLILCDLIITLFIAASLYFYKRHQRTYPGFGFWIAGTLFAGIGYASIAFRGMIPLWLSVFANNGSFILAAILRLDGVLRFLKNKTLPSSMYFLPLFVLIILAYFYFIYDSLLIRLMIFSLIITGLVLVISREFFLHKPPEDRIFYMVAGAVNTAFGVELLFRAVVWWFYPENGLFDARSFHVIHFAFVMVYEVGWGIGLLIMNSQRIEYELVTARNELDETLHDLQDASKEIKVLNGLLPICSSCKKIKDDDGYWNDLESYIDNHSEARFTHSLCSDCGEKLYPGYFKSKKI